MRKIRHRAVARFGLAQSPLGLPAHFNLLLQAGVALPQFQRARPDPLFELIVRLPQGLLGLLTFGDVPEDALEDLLSSDGDPREIGEDWCSLARPADDLRLEVPGRRQAG